jgi:hypothetical protein
MHPSHAAALFLRYAVPLPPDEQGWATVATGLFVAALFGWLVWSAHRPGGYFKLGKDTWEVTRRRNPLVFWGFTAVFSALACVGLFIAGQGLVAVFRWTMR